MRSTFPVLIKDVAANLTVGATLIIGVTLDEIDEANAIWTPHLRAEEARLQVRTQHSHWDWSKKARLIQGLTNYAILGIEAQGEMQALMLWDDLCTQAKHPNQLGKDIVYISFLSTAPWNDQDIVDAPRFRGAGSLLVASAIERSIDLDYKGRIGLHSLPDAEGFYRDRCGMIDLGIDDSHERLRYFEFTPDLANQFLQKITKGKK